MRSLVDDQTIRDLPARTGRRSSVALEDEARRGIVNCHCDTALALVLAAAVMKYFGPVPHIWLDPNRRYQNFLDLTFA